MPQGSLMFSLPPDFRLSMPALAPFLPSARPGDVLFWTPESGWELWEFRFCPFTGDPKKTLTSITLPKRIRQMLERRAKAAGPTKLELV